MKFRTYNDSEGDGQLFVTEDEKGKQTTVENEFVFAGFSNGIHPYHRKQLNWIVQILKSKGIFLHVVEVPTVQDMSTEEYSDSITMDTIRLPKKEYKKSKDGHQYILFQDTEMGRGWACLIKDDEILTQDHRDNVRDELEEGEFIRSFGIDYKVESKDLEKLKESYFGKD